MPEPPPTPPAGTAPVTTPASAARWQLRLLGGFELDDGRHRLTHLRSRATMALLARLALAPGRDHAREELCDLLWPEATASAGRARLRQTLSLLRSLLEPPGATPVIMADRRALRLVPGAIWCDGAAFEAAVRGGNGEAAMHHYRGELLPGFYDEWILAERKRLADLRDGLCPAGPAVRPGPHTEPAAPAVASRADTHTRVAACIASPLPCYWTRAFGTEPVAARLLELVGRHRLVTLHGPGGSGKTRLAVTVASALRDAPAGSFGAVDPAGALGPSATPTAFDRIGFVALQQATDTAQALDALCTTLRAQGPGGAQAMIAAALWNERALLVLDNAEQLDEDFPDAVARLLTALPRLHLLVTSRRILDLDGETTFPLNGLPLPTPDATPEAAVDNPAVSLFVSRARDSLADFQLGPRNAGSVVALVRLLAGMPLAIELAASKVRSMHPHELLQHLLGDGGTPMLDLLARSRRGAGQGDRHGSMRQVVAWSWERLPSTQQQLLRCLSIVASPVGLDAVAALAGIDRAAAQARIQALLDASMVQLSERPGAGEGSQARGWAERSATEVRVGLLAPVREFAAAALAPAEALAARRRLRLWLLGHVQARLSQGVAALAEEAELCRFAIVSAVDDGEGAVASALAVALRPYWDTATPPSALTLALERALPQTTDRLVRAELLDLLAMTRIVTGHVDVALAHARAAVEVADDDRHRSLALTRWAFTCHDAGRLDDSVDQAIDEAVHLARRCADTAALAKALSVKGLLACNVHLQYALTESLALERQGLWTRMGNVAMASAALLTRAMMWAHLGRLDEGIAAATACEQTAREHGHPTQACIAAQQLARLLVSARRFDEAAAAHRRSIGLGWEKQELRAVARALLHLPGALAPTDPHKAAVLTGFAQAHWARLYGAVNRIEARELRRTRWLLRHRLGTVTLERLLLEGAGLTLPRAIAWAA
jgi:predicted ATPase